MNEEGEFALIQLREKVLHDGVSYSSGEVIEKINNEQAQRLVDLGVAFFVYEKPFGQTEDNQQSDTKDATEKVEYYTEELNSLDYNDLKEIGKELELKFPGNISKAKLINLIIENEKAEEALSMTEVE